MFYSATDHNWLAPHREMADRMERVFYIDCAGPPLLNAPPGNASHVAGNITPLLVPDATHPSPTGTPRSAKQLAWQVSCACASLLLLALRAKMTLPS